MTVATDVITENVVIGISCSLVTEEEAEKIIEIDVVVTEIMFLVQKTTVEDAAEEEATTY
ncbi:hypothetical protein FGG79_12265 [Bacillus sp. BHET2]|uniref:hypothetical protein n=1 Tax=Bacillus sp. BHET2 TaxID=2583818 RepID=UPI00110E4C0D|nr:hypothetical protein [Bacillus sp. BHET2]TMU85959.1 hypothetical protein FGG79_12265 [Bacillus sp. BHET2]